MKKDNMYEFVDMRWNPLGGECSHKCKYCSTHRFERFPVIKEKYSGTPRLIKKELKPLGKGKMVFVVSQGDLFAGDVNAEFIASILYHCEKYPDNQYFFQTKNPEKMWSWRIYLPKKSILCTTIETDITIPDDISLAPLPIYRAQYMGMLSNYFKVQVTIEPIMKFNLLNFVNLIKVTECKKVNIGADSGKNGLPEPSKEEVLELIAELEKFTKVHQKSNLKRLLK